jgi:hypothetical protein
LLVFLDTLNNIGMKIIEIAIKIKLITSGITNAITSIIVINTIN